MLRRRRAGRCIKRPAAGLPGRYWGGWLPPLDWAPLYVIPGWIWLFAKIAFFFFVFSWVKATVPRYRYDQLMRLGWKVFLPVSLLFVVLISGYLMFTGHFA